MIQKQKKIKTNIEPKIWHVFILIENLKISLNTHKVKGEWLTEGKVSDGGCQQI